MRSLVVGIMMLFLATAVHAGQAQGQAQGQIGINKQGQQQGQIGINKQAQGQIGINKSSNKNSSKAKASGGDAKAIQGQVGIGQGNNTTIGGDTFEAVVGESTSWPDTPSTAGKDEQSVYSIFGGVGSNRESARVRFQHQMMILDILHSKKLITDEEYADKLLGIYDELSSANKNTKVLGILPVGCKNPIVGTLACF